MKTPEPQRRGHAIPASSIKREAVQWLWAGRIALRSVTLLVGDPGLGKSLLTCALAASVSKDGGYALIATAEDSLSATARPRLEAAEADLDQVSFFEMQTDDGLPTGTFLPDDVLELERLAEENHATLIVVDPLMAHLPAEVNSWRDQSVRLALAPLHALAERQNCAVLVVAHLNKAMSAEPLRRIGGSVGIPAAARSVLLLAREPGDETDTRRVCAHVKCNVAPLAPSLIYELDPIVLPATNGDPDAKTVRLVERGESEHQGPDLLGVERGDPEERDAIFEAQEFLRAELEDGPRPAKEMQRESRDAGISPTTLGRAKQKLKVSSEREGGIGALGRWVWKLPLSTPTTKAPLEESEAGALSENGSTKPVFENIESLSGSSQSYGAVSASTTNGRPLPGDELYPVALAEARQHGHITEHECSEAYEHHKLVERARA